MGIVDIYDYMFWFASVVRGSMDKVMDMEARHVLPMLANFIRIGLSGYFRILRCFSFVPGCIWDPSRGRR